MSYTNELPNSWQWQRCQNVIDVRDGTHDTPKYLTSGIPLITSKNLKNDGQLDFTDVAYISHEDHEDIQKRSRVDRGDILFAMIGTIGNPVLVDLDTEFSIKNVALFKFQHSDVHAKYFYYLLQSSIVTNQLTENARGVTQKFVSLKVLRELAIPLPPIEEQQRIAGILARADRLRQLRRYALQLSEGYLQSVFLQMFGDLTLNPHNWNIENLGKMADIPTGVQKGRKFKGKKTVTVPYLRVANVQAGFLDLSEIKTIEALPADVEKLKLMSGDILMTEGGDFDKLGRGAVWKRQVDPCIHQNHVFRVRLNRQRVLPKYFAQLLLTPYAKNYFLKSSKQTTNLATINKTQLRGFPVPIPLLALQQKFAEISCQFDRLRSQQHEAARQANHLFSTLLHRAFRGEL